jgi:hypothetical protein
MLVEKESLKCPLELKREDLLVDEHLAAYCWAKRIRRGNFQIRQSDKLGKKEIAQLLITYRQCERFSKLEIILPIKGTKIQCSRQNRTYIIRIVPYTGRLSYWRPWDV